MDRVLIYLLRLPESLSYMIDTKPSSLLPSSLSDIIDLGTSKREDTDIGCRASERAGGYVILRLMSRRRT